MIIPCIIYLYVYERRYILIAGKECEYNRGFRLLLHTKLPAPHYSPELQAHTTLINFTVTQAGLEDQLLRNVVTQERPDLEIQKVIPQVESPLFFVHSILFPRQRNCLGVCFSGIKVSSSAVRDTEFAAECSCTQCAVTTQQNHFKIELKRLEDELLTCISGAEGSFLDDTALVEKLEDTKQTVTNIESKVKGGQVCKGYRARGFSCYTPQA